MTLEKLTALNATSLQEYANILKLNGYSKNHITGILTVFQSAMDYAVEPLHYITQNPMKLIKYPKVERKPRERIILSLDEWQQIIKRFEDSRVIHHEVQLAFDYHSLRHTHATMLIEAGANVKNVQVRLGHTNIHTTLQTYMHDTEKMGTQSVELFEQITHAKTS